MENLELSIDAILLRQPVDFVDEDLEFDVRIDSVGLDEVLRQLLHCVIETVLCVDYEQ